MTLTANGYAERPVNAGVIGVGTMGQHHARVYSELPGVDFVGVNDADADRAAAVASNYGVRALSRDALLDAVDAVSIAVPTPYHYETALTCIDHGVDVLIEKPIVSDPEDGKRLLARARREGVTVQVGHVERFNPAVRTLSEIAPDLDVIAVDARRLGPPPERTIDDSAVLDLMIHDIDVLLSLVDGTIEAASAVGVDENRHASAQLRFDDGVVATLTASRLTQEKVRTLSITARECRVNVDYIDQSITVHRRSLPEYVEDDGDIRYRHESIVERPTVQNGEPLKEELAAFVSAATEGTEPVVTVEDGLCALEVARRIDQLAAQKQSPKEVTEPFGPATSAIRPGR